MKINNHPLDLDMKTAFSWIQDLDWMGTPFLDVSTSKRSFDRIQKARLR